MNLAKWSVVAMMASWLLADDSEKLNGLIVAGQGGVVTIPAGDYVLDGAKPLPLFSGMTVFAYGARFHLPKKLGDKARIVLFAGENVSDFRWFGGHFIGNVFDPGKADNIWEPNVNTRAILITTTPGGRTENLTFRDVSADGVAGAVITVLGAEKPGSESEVVTFARNVTLENCTLERSGKFMWDYGYLWQITVWPESYTEQERVMAAKYFRQDLIRGSLRLADGDDRVFFDNAKKTLSVSKVRPEAVRGHDSVCFFGDAIPRNLVRGKQYFVVDSTPTFIRVSEQPGGVAIRFMGASGPNAKLIHDLSNAWPALYAPTGSGPGKGSFDLTGCQKVIVRGCRFSALGDTMHIQKTHGVIFCNNHITGSRMGAFFLAEFCKDAVITGNTVDGSNGSRVMSVEKSSENVTVIGNTFRNGGRGSWINQPHNFVLASNVFVNNTTKCEHDPHRGRRTFVTGDYEHYSELYFTTYEPNGRYGNVVVRDNIFTTGPEAEHAITFAAGGDTLLVADNVFRGGARDIARITGCVNVILRGNVGESPVPARNFRSDALGRDVAYSVYIPEGKPPEGGWPLVLLLHGAGRNHRTIVDDPVCWEAVKARQLAIIFADCGGGWYVDNPMDIQFRYQSMVHELLDVARQRLPVSSKTERTGICGWSMGGYGAMRFAEAYPCEIGAVATAIALLDFPNPLLPKEQNHVVPPPFGKDESMWSKFNCMTSVEELRGKALLIVSAKGAFDAQMNRNFHARLLSAGIGHDFREVDGGHDFPTVQAMLPLMLDFLEGHLK